MATQSNLETAITAIGRKKSSLHLKLTIFVIRLCRLESQALRVMGWRKPGKNAISSSSGDLDSLVLSALIVRLIASLALVSTHSAK